jgi:hypothetical protein
MPKRVFEILIVVILSFALDADAKFYTFRDESGNIHLTDYSDDPRYKKVY